LHWPGFSGAAGQIDALVRAVREAIAPIPVRVHFHNTRNTGLANVWAAVVAGATTVDASIGGFGGCPFAPAATGNVPTEDVVYLLERSGISTGLSLEGLIESTNWLKRILGREAPALLGRAGIFPPATESIGE
jgi:hydroxymethylglutaryl-CoA lyase